MTVKCCGSFLGMVNVQSIFCPELQKLLKPIYDLTRKVWQFIWGEEHRIVFEEIRNSLAILPAFNLQESTATFATGSALYQIQNGKPKLIAYANKRLPEAARNYSCTELEMCGLAINIASIAHLLKIDLDAIVDYLAPTHIIKSKAELTTTIIKILLEILSSYSFNLYYIKGKNMIFSDF